MIKKYSLQKGRLKHTLYYFYKQHFCWYFQYSVCYFAYNALRLYTLITTNFWVCLNHWYLYTLFTECEF